MRGGHLERKVLCAGVERKEISIWEGVCYRQG